MNDLPIEVTDVILQYAVPKRQFNISQFSLVCSRWKQWSTPTLCRL